MAALIINGKRKKGFPWGKIIILGQMSSEDLWTWLEVLLVTSRGVLEHGKISHCFPVLLVGNIWFMRSGYGLLRGLLSHMEVAHNLRISLDMTGRHPEFLYGPTCRSLHRLVSMECPRTDPPQIPRSFTLMTITSFCDK